MTDLPELMTSLLTVQTAGIKAGLQAGDAERERLQRERDEALDMAEDVLDLIEGYEDVRDGSDGPRPNNAMQAGNRLRALLAKHGRTV